MPSTVPLICGNNSMSLECLEFCVLATIGQTRWTLFSDNARLIFATRKSGDALLDDSGRLPPDDLERLLSFRRQTKTLDPRDIIFSSLVLFSPSVFLSLSLDYLILVKDLFNAVAKHIIPELGELRILCLVDDPQHLEGEAFLS